MFSNYFSLFFKKFFFFNYVYHIGNILCYSRFEAWRVATIWRRLQIPTAAILVSRRGVTPEMQDLLVGGFIISAGIYEGKRCFRRARVKQ